MSNNGYVKILSLLILLGFLLSIGRAILTPEPSALHEAVKQIPVSQLLVETDSGDPSDVKLVAQKIADLKGLSQEELGRTTTSSLKAMLRL